MTNYNTASNMQQTMNDKIYDRNLPSQMLQPYFDARPVMTKYALMPIIDTRKETTVNVTTQPSFNIESVFNPGNSSAPWSGLSSNINVESELRNQFFALQHCNQSAFIPNSNSDLYIHSFNQTTDKKTVINNQEQFDLFNPNPDKTKVGISMFNNSTRSQLNDI